MSMYPGGYYPAPPPQPYPGYPGYPGFPGYVPPAPGPRNGLGIAALVLGVVGMLAAWSVFGGLVFGVTAAVLGFLAYRRVKNHQADNMAVAVAGIVLGTLAIVLSVVFIVIWNGFLDQVGYSEYSDCMRAAGQNPNAVNECATQFQSRLNDMMGTPTTTR